MKKMNIYWMRVLNFAPVLFMSGLFLMTSCKKKEGCTNENAENYNSFAKVDNGSCTYSGSLVLWYKSGVFTGLASTGVTNLSVYVNGQFAMQHPIGSYSSSEPVCGTENTMTVEVDLGKNESGTYPYEIYDQNNNLIWSGNITVSGNGCVAQELTL